MQKDNSVYIKQILDYISEIETFTANIDKDQFIESKLHLFAVIRCYEVIGEAVKRLNYSFRDKYPNVPWQFIAGFRDVLIHNYEGIYPISVWKTTKTELPKLKTQLLQILEDEQ